jgi:protein TonB
MSAPRQVPVQPTEVSSTYRQSVVAPPVVESDDPVVLLRNVISRLKSSNGGLPDTAQVTRLLEEAQEALEHATVIGQAMEGCQEFLGAAQFDRALEALDAGLAVYPDDPVLAMRRREVESQQHAFHQAARVRTALEEANWFFEQNRADLAVQSLKEETAELPGEPALISRLEELEALLPRWEQARNVQSVLTQGSMLEQSQQWEAALTVLEEAARLYPESLELAGAAQQLRTRLLTQQRQRKLARRLDRIRQQTTEGLWRQALTLLDSTQAEFPGAPELDLLRAQVNAGLKGADCEIIVAEVRQFLADGELELAEQALTRGRKSLGPDPVFESLERELEADRNYDEEVRAAQICLGRRQLDEAERILTSITDRQRPEARALLDAVQQARLASEEGDFFDRGRKKALALIEQEQFAQAADLLSQILSLFPGNPILERDLAVARDRLKQETPQVPVPAGEEHCDSAPVVPITPEGPEHRVIWNGVPSAESSSSRFRRAAITAAALLLVISGTGAVLKVTHRGAPSSKPVAVPAATQTSTDAEPLGEQPGATTPAAVAAPTPVEDALRESIAVTTTSVEPNLPKEAPLREFVPPNPRQMPNQSGDSTLPQPPGTEPAAAGQPLRALPGNLVGSLSAPAPPPPAPPEPTAAAPAAADKPLPVGGRIKEAQLVSQTTPVYPVLASQRRVSGNVKLQAVIDQHGNVSDVKVLSGDPILAKAAKAAVQQWKYLPATLNDQPISTTAIVQIMFGDQKK